MQIIHNPKACEWYKAMANQIKFIIKKNTCVMIKRPKNNNVIGCRMILRNKDTHYQMV